MYIFLTSVVVVCNDSVPPGRPKKAWNIFLKKVNSQSRDLNIANETTGLRILPPLFVHLSNKPLFLKKPFI